MTDIAHWQDRESPLRIEYSRAALEQIRQRAVDGLKALPRTGLSVGGLLLGERAGARVRIVDSAELVCSHAFGPSFLLTPHEKAQARELIQSLENPAVVGWYCSRARGALELADTDLAIYRELFPAQWQITLMVQAALEGPSRAVFFFSNKSGVVTKGVERELSLWIASLGEGDSEDLPPDTSIHQAIDVSIDRAIDRPIDRLIDPLIDPPRFTLGDARDDKPVDSEGRVREGRLGWVMSWVLTAVAALAVGAAVFEVQNTWLSEPPPQAAPVQTPAPVQVP